MAKEDDNSGGQDGKSTGFELVRLTHLVDLGRDPTRETLALWYEDQIMKGVLQVWGSRNEFDALLPESVPRARLEPIPHDAWGLLLIEWSTGQAVLKVADTCHLRPAWGALHLRRMPAPDTTSPAEGTTLAVTVRDAVRLAQRWRELHAL